MISLIFSAEKFQIGAGLSGYVAEITSAFLCARLGIMPTVRHADYLGAWLEVIREDARAIFRAASQAAKAADSVVGGRQGAAPDQREAAA